MKKTLVATLLGLFVLLSIPVSSQSKADQLIGYYLTYNEKTGEETSQVQIFKATNNKYYGKIVWLKEPNENGKPKVDSENPDKAEQGKPLIGLQILRGFSYNEKSEEWTDGSIYDPKNGKTYNCFIKFDGPDNLKIRGYVGKAWMGLGRTATWVKSTAR